MIEQEMIDKVAHLEQCLQKAESRSICRWVKASERQPQKEGWYPVRYWKGKYGSGRFMSGWWCEDHSGGIENSELEWLEEIAAEQYNDQVAALLSSNKEWGEKYSESCRERAEKQIEANDYLNSLNIISDSLPEGSTLATLISKTLAKHIKP